MKIAIQAADLDHERIDGTRVYILNLLKYFGKLDTTSEFLIYHKNDFNLELAPPKFTNYVFKKIFFPIFWTQTRFALELWKEKPDVLWMPMHNTPILKRKNLKTVVTIHDLAFKYFPKHFPGKDLCKINFLTGIAIKNASHIITVSESTKRDIIKFYPQFPADKIRVIYHGFDAEVFSATRDFNEENKIKNQLGIKGNYILYCGAIQPRKNLAVLIEAFEMYKKRTGSDVQLVLAGGKAWLWQDILKRANLSPFKQDIIMPGKLKFGDLGHLYRGAGVFVFPSLYEGFGIPILEAFAAQVPVIAAQNSSLPEVGGEAAQYFESENAQELADKISFILSDENLRSAMIQKGLAQIQNFSWEKCARETLEFLKG